MAIPILHDLSRNQVDKSQSSSALNGFHQTLYMEVCY